jgi:LAO/AO transport system kinase
MTARRTLSLDDYVSGIRAGDRAILARAITLVESQKPEHQSLAQAIIDRVLPFTGACDRVGITGVPGVGKSTTIDQFGLNLCTLGKRVAVLAVDPTSQRTGGSILGDKTRMARLAQHENAFVRPSPTGKTLGGVTRKTRETMLLVEAAKYDVVIVETVGVGQSETAVASMVDIFVVLLLPGGGDDLQGIKKGIIERADLLAINKADGDNLGRATRAAADYRNALAILTPPDALWHPPVLTISGQHNLGLDRLWVEIEKHRGRMQSTGARQRRRAEQAIDWMQSLIELRLLQAFHTDPRVSSKLAALEAEVRSGRITAPRAVDQLFSDAR